MRSLLRGGTATIAACALALAVMASSAFAASGANFVATGHDMDYHCDSGTTEECEYLKIVVDKVRAGSTLPILAIDQGTEVKGALEAAGYGASEIVTVDPTEAATFAATPFVDGSGHPLYSAIITASDSTCGGCDDTPEGEANINARAADFASYFNAGGGILALAGADEFETYYNFVPLKVAATAVEAPFTVTPEGAALGVNEAMANCCATHNSFSIPPAPLVVLENDSAGQAETIAALGVAIGEGGFVPVTPPAQTPAAAPPAATTTTVAPSSSVKASVTKAPKQCKSARSVTVHWKAPGGVTLDKVSISLNGKRSRSLSGGADHAKISFAGRGKGAVKVKIVGAAAGASYVSTRIFHPCVPAAEASQVHTLVLRRI
ncbi:MAG: hypothetical protein ACHQHO_06710 [Solirubrobacterales bacterium]